MGKSHSTISQSIAFFGALHLANPAFASPSDLFGAGTRSSALAMTGAAYADNQEATFSNPAGLALAHTNAFSVGFEAGTFRVNVDGERTALEPFRAITMGLLAPLPLGGPLRDCIVFGMLLSTPPELTLHGDIAFPEVPQFPVLSRTQVLSLQVGFGFDLGRLVPGLRVGTAVSMLASVVGDVSMRMSADQQVDTDVASQIVAATSPIIGIGWDIDIVSLGAVYRGPVESTMDFDVETAGLPVKTPVLTVGGLLEYVPPTLVFEAAARPARVWLVAAQLATRWWSRWPGPQQPTSESSTAAPDPSFSNVFSPRIGIERTVTRGQVLTIGLRGGYAWEPSPAPPARTVAASSADSDEVPLRYLDNDRHVWTAGTGLSFRVGPAEHLRVDGFAQLHWLAPRDHEVAQEDADQPMRTQGVAFVGGLSMGATW